MKAAKEINTMFGEYAVWSKSQKNIFIYPIGMAITKAD